MILEYVCIILGAGVIARSLMKIIMKLEGEMNWHKYETIPGNRPGEKSVIWVSDNGWVIRSEYIAIPHANSSGYWVRPYFYLFDPEGVNIERYELMVRAKKAAAEMAARRESIE